MSITILLIISVLSNIILAIILVGYINQSNEKISNLKDNLLTKEQSFNLEKLQLISKLTLFTQIKVSSIGEVEIAEFEVIEKNQLNTVNTN